MLGYGTRIFFCKQVTPPQLHSVLQYGAGDAYVADSLELLKTLPPASANTVMTSPPYALYFKKEYGNAAKQDYVAWFLPFAAEIFRILPEDGNFVLNIGGSYNEGTPTHSLYHFKLLIALVEQMPAEGVSVRRIRIKDAVEYVWWLSNTPWPKANNRAVLKPYSKDMERLNRRGLHRTTRPSGHNIKPSFSQIEPGGSILPNMVEKESPTTILKLGNNAANDSYTERCKMAGMKIHPARFPAALPEFFLKLLTDEGGRVLAPFAGSNTPGAVAEKLQRRWIAIDNVEAYLEASKFRFD